MLAPRAADGAVCSMQHTAHDPLSFALNLKAPHCYCNNSVLRTWPA